MAKKAKKPVVPNSIDVPYDLLDLPSAQHKAGLAGLLLQIEGMRERQEKGQLGADVEVPEVIKPTSTTVEIRFTKRSVQDLFDDLYAAEIVEVRSKSKWQGKVEKRQEVNPDPRPGEPRRWYVYDTVQPAGHFLRRFTEGDKEAWHKLWRDMIFDVPRNRPTTRQAYKSRADDRPTKEGGDAWKALLAMEKARTKGIQATAELASSLMLAVQAITAEGIPFEDRVDTQLLLHFWVLTARIFVPQRVDVDGRAEFVGYSLAIPEVSELKKFCSRYTQLLDRLDAKRNLFRPAGAVIALPEQGPLEFLHDLDRLTAERAIAEGPSAYVSGVEFFHMVVAGNNVKLKAHGRIPVEAGLIEEYASIRRDFRNPEVVAGLILALLRGRPWFAEFDATVHEREWSYLVHSSAEGRRTPKAMIGFAREVARKFGSLEHFVNPSEVSSMSESDPPPEAVDAIIYDLVRAYVRERACARAGVKAEDNDWWTKAADERRDVCAKLFLEFRSRHGDEFVSYFTDTIASVSQWLPEDRYLAVSRALMRPHTPEEGPDRPRTRDDIKTLTMLALAAHSRSLRTRADENNGSDDPTHDHPTENAG